MALPKSHLRDQLDALPAGMPAVLIIGGDALALVGTYTGDVELIGVADADPSTVAAKIMIAGCSCEDPETAVDPGCHRHYPTIPQELLARVAAAIAASRDWAMTGQVVDGVHPSHVNAAIAALTVLLRPGRHGVTK